MFDDVTSSNTLVSSLTLDSSTSGTDNAVMARWNFEPPDDPPPEMTGKLAPLLPRLPVLVGAAALEVPIA